MTYLVSPGWRNPQARLVFELGRSAAVLFCCAALLEGFFPGRSAAVRSRWTVLLELPLWGVLRGAHRVLDDEWGAGGTELSVSERQW